MLTPQRCKPRLRQEPSTLPARLGDSLWPIQAARPSTPPSSRPTPPRSGLAKLTEISLGSGLMGSGANRSSSCRTTQQSNTIPFPPGRLSMFKTPLTLMALASLTIVTWSDAQSDLPPLADQVDPIPTPASVPAATPAPIVLPAAAPAPGKWLTNEDEAINQATQQGKVILVDFDADWCSWCIVM